MNKQALIARVQRHMGAGASRDAARAAVNAVLDSILQTAAEEEKATLPHLGTFEYRDTSHATEKGCHAATKPPPSPPDASASAPPNASKNLQKANKPLPPTTPRHKISSFPTANHTFYLPKSPQACILRPSYDTTGY